MSMTLNEAIEHCKEVAKSNVCKKCREEHEQLAKWLEDYKNSVDEPIIKECNKENKKLILGVEVIDYK